MTYTEGCGNIWLAKLARHVADRALLPAKEPVGRVRSAMSAERARELVRCTQEVTEGGVRDLPCTDRDISYQVNRKTHATRNE